MPLSFTYRSLPRTVQDDETERKLLESDNDSDHIIAAPRPSHSVLRLAYALFFLTISVAFTNVLLTAMLMRKSHRVHELPHPNVYVGLFDPPNSDEQ